MSLHNDPTGFLTCTMPLQDSRRAHNEDQRLTFHFLVGECTITLEDVALQHGVRVDSRLVMGATWSDSGLSFIGTQHGDVTGYKIRLDNMTPEQIFTVLSQEMDLHNGDLKGCFIAGSGEDQIFSLRSIPKIHVPSCCPTHLSVCLPTIYVMIPRDKKEAMMETV
ncbi:hypothetical protein JHK87_044883 [Glycine soja]|nr:hypothetical protein JHK87_044883 [Glycine soja]